jgi:hypothetical protein
LYDSRTKRVRLLQANKVQIQINNRVNNSQIFQSQKEVVEEEKVTFLKTKENMAKKDETF